MEYPSPFQRIILDTNVYGFFIEQGKQELAKRLSVAEHIQVYGFDLIRNELRNHPKGKIGNRNVRQDLLRLYDVLVQSRTFRTNDRIASIATEYGLSYRGGISRAQLVNDFLIVACASIHGLDVIVTEDRHSMGSAPALRAYAQVNQENGLRTPLFYSFAELEKRSDFPV
ncbi:MAG: type II toxin-antitoxin system VapC family toxin [Candidatus Diapherotrites archaeon]